MKPHHLKIVLPLIVFPQSLLEIHLINMGHSKPKLVFSQIWLAHMKLSPKWLKKLLFFGYDHIEKFFTIRVPNPPNQYGTKHFNFFFISNFKIDPSHDQVQLWASFKAHWNYPKSASKTHLIEYGTPCIRTGPLIIVLPWKTYQWHPWGQLREWI